ncbi:hypothetical protein C8Q72DRAFT_824522, partial [Fomitopsis betulina]
MVGIILKHASLLLTLMHAIYDQWRASIYGMRTRRRLPILLVILTATRPTPARDEELWRTQNVCAAATESMRDETRPLASAQSWNTTHL